MLRNNQALLLLLSRLSNQKRQIQQHGALCNKLKSNAFREGKIMGKLFGDRVKGSKKSWISHTDVTPSTSVAFKDSSFGKRPKSGGKNASRRMTVLNKLFMSHITDQMATGEMSERILGKGLQISGVKISQDFAFVNVYWITTGDVANDTMLEHELQKCSGLLRHELSQLGLMGVVPRIKFVKDKLFTNAANVETLLKNMDFGEDEDNPGTEDNTKYETNKVKQEFFHNNIQPQTEVSAPNSEPESIFSKENQNANCGLPEMRHDVLGLDHKSIMLSIYTKMRKSKQAWEGHEQNVSLRTAKETSPASVEKQINSGFVKSTVDSNKFEAFLAKRKERKITPERKKYIAKDHNIDLTTTESQEYNEEFNKPTQNYESTGYIIEDKKL